VLLTFQLFDVVYREETLLNVIRSVTRNGRSIILTAVLALILVYMFSIIGYMFFKDDFLLSVDQDVVGKYQSLRSECRALIDMN
jgi:inositol 1,4,5-triphosphate receptor type 1